MIGERKNISADTDYGALIMRPYDIDGNEINAFYDSSDRLVFVLDNTINVRKPNVLLVINPDAERKWDEILSDDYNVDLETIRPKQDNKYQKLDIEYSGLNVYDNLINAYNSGDGLADELNQLNVLRDSAVRHSAMTRLNTANEVISKTNATIVKTKESIIRLQARIKTLRADLSATKKNIGRVPTKQSASRVLKLESQLEALSEKLKRAKKRLESAQKRLEVATVDAELASELLNQPATEIRQETKTKGNNQPLMAAPKNAVQVIEPEDSEEDIEEYDAEEDIEPKGNDSVAPLFDKDPQILNNDIAFKPIAFDVPDVSEVARDETPASSVPELPEPPVVPELPEPKDDKEIPYLDDVFVAPEIKRDDENISEQNVQGKPVLETLSPLDNIPEPAPEPYVAKEQDDTSLARPVLETLSPLDNVPEIEEISEQEYPILDTNTRQYEPEVVQESETIIEHEPVKEMKSENELVAPMTESMHAEIVGAETNEKHKPTLAYYVLLIVLIALSVFTLWLYQKSNTDTTTPMLTATVEKTTTLKKSDRPKKAVKPVAVQEEITEDTETVFLDEVQPASVDSDESKDTVEIESEIPDVVPNESAEPVVIDDVPARVMTSGMEDEETKTVASEENILANKPVYEPGAKHEDMFVSETVDDYEAVDDNDMVYVDEENPYFDAEEAEYQSELEYEE